MPYGTPSPLCINFAFWLCYRQVKDVDTLAGQAKGIIKSIQARAVMNKCILGMIVFLLLGIDGVLLYLYVKKH